MSNLALYEIAQAYRHALENIADSDELPPEVIRDTLESLEGDFDTKATNVAKFILSLEANAEAISEASKAMELRALRIRKRVESLKNYLLLQMQLVDRHRIDAPDIHMRRQDNPPAVVVMDESIVPPHYWRQPLPPPPVIDKKAIMETLKTGAEVPGCYANRGEHIRISI